MLPDALIMFILIDVPGDYNTIEVVTASQHCCCLCYRVIADIIYLEVCNGCKKKYFYLQR
jgi:hypothetical protein